MCKCASMLWPRLTIVKFWRAFHGPMREGGIWMSVSIVKVASKSAISISIDVASPASSAAGSRRKVVLGDKIENVAEEILARFKRQAIPATCAFENPLESKLA